MKSDRALSAKRQAELEALAKRLLMPFGNLSILDHALTHSSYAAEYGGTDFERLEFFGDAVLKFVVAEYLFKQYPSMHEGELTQISAVLISAKTLESVGRELDLGAYIQVGKGVPMRASIIARSTEAVLGAMYLDAGFEHVTQFVIEKICSRAQSVASDEVKENYKAQLQQWTQARALGTPDYAVASVQGPPHDPLFQVCVKVDGRAIAEGCGRSKKAAEQAAAQAAMDRLLQSEQ